jgi:acyl-CoA thioesterase FadM
VSRRSVDLVEPPFDERSIALGAHVRFDVPLRVAWQAFRDLLDELPPGHSLNVRELAVVSQTASYRREMFVGAAELELAITRIGRSSLVLSYEIWQAGQSAAAGELTLARVGEGRGASVPFTDHQRATLTQLTR